MPAPWTLLIVNPSAQNGQLGRRWPELGAALRRELGSFEEALTVRPGDATRLAREGLESGVDTVVAVGGDGTANEVANGFFDGERPRAPGAAMALRCWPSAQPADSPDGANGYERGEQTATRTAGL